MHTEIGNTYAICLTLYKDLVVVAYNEAHMDKKLVALECILKCCTQNI